jgi:hypothetical protein
MIANPFIPVGLKLTQVTGVVNNLNVGPLLPVTTIQWNGASDVTIGGIVGGKAGYIVNFASEGGGSVAYFVNASGSASAGNVLNNIVQSGNTPVAVGGYITYFHDGASWHLISHEQGAPITVPFNAGNFTASGAMTWTVGAGNVTDQSYRVSGQWLIYSVNVSSTTIGGVVDVELRIALPLAFTCSGTNSTPCQVLNPGLASVLSVGGPVATQSYIRFFSNLNGAVWNVGNTAIVRGEFTFPIN